MINDIDDCLIRELEDIINKIRNEDWEVHKYQINDTDSFNSPMMGGGKDKKYTIHLIIHHK